MNLIPLDVAPEPVYESPRVLIIALAAVIVLAAVAVVIAKMRGGKR